MQTFWLDAHFSHGNTARGDVNTPVLSELATVLARGRGGDVILVDDARELGQPGWPNEQELRDFARARDPERMIKIAQNIVRIPDTHGFAATRTPSRA